jgi:hypothetical protein
VGCATGQLDVTRLCDDAPEKARQSLPIRLSPGVRFGGAAVSGSTYLLAVAGASVVIFLGVQVRRRIGRARADRHDSSRVTPNPFGR